MRYASRRRGSEGQKVMVLTLCSDDAAASAAAALGVTGPCSLSLLLWVLMMGAAVVPSATAAPAGEFAAAFADVLAYLSPSALACCCLKALIRPSFSDSPPMAVKMRANFSACCCLDVGAAA